MPRPNLFAIRETLKLSEKQAHRMVTFSAVEDIVACNRPRWQWTHPTVARQLGVAPEFLSMVQSYLDYRRTRCLSTERGIRFHADPRLAQVYRTGDGMPMDLLNLGGSLRYEDQVTALLQKAAHLKIRLDGDLAADVERHIGRLCGLAWEDLNGIFARQRSAQAEEAKAA